MDFDFKAWEEIVISSFGLIFVALILTQELIERVKVIYQKIRDFQQVKTMTTPEQIRPLVCHQIKPLFSNIL